MRKNETVKEIEIFATIKESLYICNAFSLKKLFAKLST